MPDNPKRELFNPTDEKAAIQNVAVVLQDIQQELRDIKGYFHAIANILKTIQTQGR